MSKLLIETVSYDDCTVGRLSYKNFRCLTLELPWKNNQPGISCVPQGVYDSGKYSSPTKGECVLLSGVTGRTYIEIHGGNYVSQIRGCILVGDSIKYLDNDTVLDVTNSRLTLQKLLTALPEAFEVEIIRH